MRVPGDGAGKPPIPPPITPKEGSNAQETKPEHLRQTPAPKEGFTQGPGYDAQAIAARMAALTLQAKEKELKDLTFKQIVEQAIEETGFKDPQEAMEEANRKKQKEIDAILKTIKENEELMEEAEAWESFGKILEEQLSEEQIEEFFGAVKESISEYRGKG